MGRMRVVVVALESSQSLDVLGPVEVFQAASRIAAQRGLAWATRSRSSRRAAVASRSPTG